MSTESQNREHLQRCVIIKSFCYMLLSFILLLPLGVLGALSVLPTMAPDMLIFDLMGQGRMATTAAIMVLLILLFLLRRWILLLMAGFLLYYNLTIMMTLTPVPPAMLAENGKPLANLRVMSFNSYHYNSDPTAAAAVIRNINPDVILFVEFYPDVRASLDTALSDLYPYRYPGDKPSRYAWGVFSKYPWQGHGRNDQDPVVPLPDTKQNAVHVTLNVNGQPVDLVGTHAYSPRSEYRLGLRDSVLRALGHYVRSLENPVIVAGDMNTTPWQPALRDMQNTGLLNNTEGVLPTTLSWPAENPWPLRLPIDQILLSRQFCAAQKHAAPYAGSDHLPVYADVMVCGR